MTDILYSPDLHTADLKVSFRGIYHIAAFASMKPHNHLCMYLCGTLDVRSFGVILFPPPEYDKEYSRHILRFWSLKNWIFYTKKIDFSYTAKWSGNFSSEFQLHFKLHKLVVSVQMTENVDTTVLALGLTFTCRWDN